MKISKRDGQSKLMHWSEVNAFICIPSSRKVSLWAISKQIRRGWYKHPPMTSSTTLSKKCDKIFIYLWPLHTPFLVIMVLFLFYWALYFLFYINLLSNICYQMIKAVFFLSFKGTSYWIKSFKLWPKKSNKLVFSFTI